MIDEFFTTQLAISRIAAYIKYAYLLLPSPYPHYHCNVFVGFLISAFKRCQLWFFCGHLFWKVTETKRGVLLIWILQISYPPYKLPFLYTSCYCDFYSYFCIVIHFTLDYLPSYSIITNIWLNKLLNDYISASYLTQL